MDGPHPRRRPLALLISALAVACGLLAAPSFAAADTQTHEFRVPITVGGYEVLQSVSPAPHPQINGYVTRMEADIVNENGRRIPIQRLMLHHIVFVNLDRPDATCDSFLNWDNETTFPGAERFFAAGEERAKMVLPPGYGYKLNPSDYWGLLYMVMNHRQPRDEAFIEYEVTVDTDPSLTPVEPYWLDVENCKADPIYNVPGTGGPGSTHSVSEDVTVPSASRVVAAGGHVHGGARMLTLTQPDCENREAFRSVPTWGKRDHPFYNVRPVLHEPGPANMSAMTSATGIPVGAGERLRLNALYDNSRPHTRVMGIMIAYLAPDPGAAESCGPLPSDVETYRGNVEGRPGPVPFRVPLTGLDENGRAVSINAPPGRLRSLKPGSTIDVGDRYFAKRNVRVPRGSELKWRFQGAELHNVTLANGPEGIGSPNLDGGRAFSHRFSKPGTYRLFCALHPVQMTERVVVGRAAKKQNR
jgi:plastocyanin